MPRYSGRRSDGCGRTLRGGRIGGVGGVGWRPIGGGWRPTGVRLETGLRGGCDGGQQSQGGGVAVRHMDAVGHDEAVRGRHGRQQLLRADDVPIESPVTSGPVHGCIEDDDQRGACVTSAFAGHQRAAVRAVTPGDEIRRVAGRIGADRARGFGAVLPLQAGVGGMLVSGRGHGVGQDDELAAVADRHTPREQSHRRAPSDDPCHAPVPAARILRHPHDSFESLSIRVQPFDLHGCCWMRRRERRCGDQHALHHRHHQVQAPCGGERECSGHQRALVQQQRHVPDRHGDRYQHPAADTRAYQRESAPVGAAGPRAACHTVPNAHLLTSRGERTRRWPSAVRRAAPPPGRGSPSPDAWHVP